MSTGQAGTAARDEAGHMILAEEGSEVSLVVAA
jgi:hypothetical protein